MAVVSATSARLVFAKSSLEDVLVLIFCSPGLKLCTWIIFWPGARAYGSTNLRSRPREQRGRIRRHDTDSPSSFYPHLERNSFHVKSSGFKRNCHPSAAGFPTSRLYEWQRMRLSVKRAV